MADTNGDGISDLIVGRGLGGPPEVKVFDGKTLAVLYDFYAFSTTKTVGIFVFLGGVFVGGA